MVKVSYTAAEVRPAPTKTCTGCGSKVVQFWLQGTRGLENEGTVIKCDPEMVDDGQFFLVGKLFHRRRETDTVGKFYRKHRCSGWNES